MVANITEINGINSIDDAKNYANYNGQPLDNSEKAIFNSLFLKKTKPDGTLEDDLDKVRGTMTLLANLKEAQAELPKEQSSSEENLSTEGNELLIEFLNERRKDSVAYQLVNTYTNSEQVDKIIKDYQKVQFRKENKSLKAEERVALAACISIAREGEEKDKKIKEARKVMDENMSIAEAKAYKTRVQSIVNALKADLDAGGVGRRLLKEIFEVQKRTANVIFRVSSSESNSLGSIIETGIKAPYSNSSYTHPTYLSDDLPWQMKQLFKQFDKDKLFTLIDSKFTGNLAEAKKIKAAFERIMNSEAVPSEDWLKYVDKSIICLDCPPDDINTKSDNPDKYTNLYVPETLEESRNFPLNLSDAFLFMNALFPQNTPSLDFSNSDYLKVGSNDALPFTDNTNNLTTEHDMYWRGRTNDNLAGKSYRTFAPNVADSISPAFPSKKLCLSWAGAKGKSIPEFFWQVYNNPEATQFTSKKSLDKNANPITFWDGDIAVYENKLVSWKVGTAPELLEMAYRERVKGIMSGDIAVLGHVITDKLDPNIYWTDFENSYYEIVDEAHESFQAFRKDAEQIDTYNYLRNLNLTIGYMNEGKSDIDNDTIDIWDKMIDEVCDGKIANAEQFRNNWTAELTKRTEINVRENEAEKKLKRIQDKINGLANGKVAQIRVQFATLGEKLKAAPVTNLRTLTPGEAAGMHNLYHLLQKLEGADNLPDIPNLAFANGTTVNYTPQTYMNALKALEDRWDGINKGAYGVWKGLGSSFADRLAKWQKDEGKNLEEDAIKTYLLLVKTSINEIRKYRHLSPEENVDLNAIETYLTKKPELREIDIQLVFNIEADIEKPLVEKWKTYGDKGLFATDATELKKLGDIVNNLSDDDKNTFFTQLKTYLADKSGVPTMPDDTADEQDKLDYFFTLDPEHVIGAIATYQIKNDSAIKTDTENEMEAAKDPNDNTKGLDLTVYGDGTNITEAGIIRYLGEKKGGISHSFSSQQSPHQNIPPTPQKWYEKLGYWPVWGSALLIGALTIAYFQRDSISEWWNGPADEEGDNNEEDQED